MDGLDGKDGVKDVKIATRDTTYFLYPDFMVLRVEDTLFRLHVFHLMKHSQYLRHLFTPVWLRSSEENPFVVDGISAKEFRHFLRIILPSMTENLETVWENNSVSKDEWISVLKISTLWRCLRLRSLAINKLGSQSPSSSFSFRSLQPASSGTDLTPMEKIILGRKYSISGWVEAGYIALVRKGDITDEEREEIGAVESFELLRIMLGIQKAPGTASTVDTQVKTKFQAELLSIAAAAGELGTLIITSPFKF